MILKNPTFEEKDFTSRRQMISHVKKKTAPFKYFELETLLIFLFIFWALVKYFLTAGMSLQALIDYYDRLYEYRGKKIFVSSSLLNPVSHW